MPQEKFSRKDLEMKSQFPEWFAVTGITFFNRHLMPMAGQPLRCLQLGAYTGDASEYLLSNILTNDESLLVDVDTWHGAKDSLQKTMDWRKIERFYDERLHAFLESQKLIKCKETTESYFRRINEKEIFDFIYVDADHEAASVLKDGLHAIEHLSVGGILAFDDYTWNSGLGGWANPKFGVDAIMFCYSHRFDVLDIGAQVWLRLKN